jgi:hypothetical protein
MRTSAARWAEIPPMAEEHKPKYKTFQLYEDIPRWKVAIAVAVLFLAGWFGWQATSRAVALGNIPKMDFIGPRGVIEQDTTYTCVPAALAMFFRDAGIETTQYEIAVIAGTNLSGTSDRGIRKVAERYGYALAINKLDFWEIYKYGKPLVLEERHRGVLHVSYIRPYRQLKVQALEILDPIDGYLLLTGEGFYEYYGEPNSKKKCFLMEMTE